MKPPRAAIFDDPAVCDSTVVYDIARVTLHLLWNLFYDWRVVGHHNIPADGPVIIAANHTSYLDPPFLGSVMTRRCHFLARSDLFKPPILDKVYYHFHGVPVDRHSADLRAMKRMLALLKAGSMIAVFPEGTRSRDGKLGPAQPGIGYLALKSRAPVVPTAMLGVGHILAPGSNRVRVHPFTARFGPPMTFEDLQGLPRRRAIRECGDRIMAAIQQLLDQGY